MLDSREPPNGDFVAYVDKIEREQLARAMQPHKLPHLGGSGKVTTDAESDSAERQLSAAEARRVLQSLQQKAEAIPAARGALFGAIIGAVLIAFGLAAEGGTVLVLIGAVLLWHNLRKLMRTASGTPGGSHAAKKVHDTFGATSSSSNRQHNA